ncbi:unnamed protein product, partial [Discosporangium mesarthrocarpum]
PTWRQELDLLILSGLRGRQSVAEVSILSQDLLKRLPEVLQDVSQAVQKGTFLSDIVLAEGTEARYTTEGLQAVSRQLREDIFPEVLEAAPRVLETVPSSMRDLRQRSQKALASNPPNVREIFSPERVTAAIKAVREEVPNVLNRTPAGLFSPDYTVEDRREGFEVRKYSSYAVCDTTMTESKDEHGSIVKEEDGSKALTGSGEGFNTLAGYLFGNNAEDKAMDMTTPVAIDRDASGGRKMWFVMPPEVTAENAPAPRDPSVSVRQIPEEFVAVRQFPGVSWRG